MVGPVQPEDLDEFAGLYRSNHPRSNGWLEPVVRHESQAFVARDDDGELIGLALVSVFRYGLRPYGVIHELEVRWGADLHAVGHVLIEACLAWLTEHRAAFVEASATESWEKELLRSAGFIKSRGEMHRRVPPKPVQAPRRVYA